MYTELQVTTNFSFLQGASHPHELVERAAELGHTAIAITDHNTMAGIVRAHSAARKSGIRLIPACRLNLVDGHALLAYPMNKDAYASLCNLLSTGNLRTEKGKCALYQKDLEALHPDMFIICLTPPLNELHQFPPDFRKDLEWYQKIFRHRLYISAVRSYNGRDGKHLAQLDHLSSSMRIPVVAINDVHYHQPSRRPLQDLLTCIREKCTIHTAGYKLHPNAERYLKPSAEMERLFRPYPDWVRASRDIADACTFSLDELRYQYPEEITSEGRTPLEELTHLAWQGAHFYFGGVIPERTRKTILYELDFIEKMDYAAYFLTVYDIVRFARSRGILCQGRGSAANSTICYCLGITSVNPEKFDLLFERFISAARNEPPDIDVDFEHERREEVIQYIYEKYGRDRAAIVATVTQQHQRGAIRDIGKAMGLSIDTINRLSGSIWEYTDEWFEAERIREQGMNPDDKHLRKTLQLTREYMGFPRQLGQHTGGFVITRGKLTALCPVLNARMENRTCIEWNKDDIDALKFLKIDVLALGMLTCIRKSFDLAREHYGLEWTLANIPQDDPAVYDMICAADTIGVFQIESRAQQTMLPRLKPRCFYDLVIEVAIVRPGPIQGDMVHPYLRRRNGEEPVTYPSKELEDILGRTLGVPLFQEQAMKIAIVAAGFTPSEADELRRSMATFKMHGMVTRFEEKLVDGMTRRGYDEAYARRVFKQLEGFGSYGFPESHAASFAQLVYISSWIKCHYPDIFCCALLNSLPMGFYQPAQIIIDARRHGVEVREVDINYSGWDNGLEEMQDRYHAVRLGFRQIRGLREEEMRAFVQQRNGVYQSMDQLRSLLSDSILQQLADADAFRSMQMDRRHAFWEVSSQDYPTGMFSGQSLPEGNVSLPRMTPSEHVVHDYANLSFSLKAHPLQFLRQKLDMLGITPSSRLKNLANGTKLKIAGLVLVRQRPGTAGGVCFMTIEDEHGFANLVIFKNLFDTYRKEILQAKLIMAEGKLQREGDVIHVVVSKCHNFSRMLRDLSPRTITELPLLFSRADEKTFVPDSRSKPPPGEEHFPGARNFR